VCQCRLSMRSDVAIARAVVLLLASASDSNRRGPRPGPRPPRASPPARRLAVLGARSRSLPHDRHHHGLTLAALPALLTGVRGWPVSSVDRLSLEHHVTARRKLGSTSTTPIFGSREPRRADGGATAEPRRNARCASEYRPVSTTAYCRADGAETRHRNVVFFLYRRRAARPDAELRLFLGRRSSFVPIRPTACLIKRTRRRKTRISQPRAPPVRLAPRLHGSSVVAPAQQRRATLPVRRRARPRRPPSAVRVVSPLARSLRERGLGRPPGPGTRRSRIVRCRSGQA